MDTGRLNRVQHFCTYFDHRYLATGLALHESLLRHAPDSVLWVLCLSSECEATLRAANLPGMQLLSLESLERGDPDLAAVRSGRSLIEYYFTCSPCLPRYLFQVHPEIDSITYLDADLYFFSSPTALFDELADAEVGITPHRFPCHRASRLLMYGQYNVGWLTFCRSETALACLDWWRERCLEWCFDRVEPGRFADQKYLDQFSELFPRVHAISHRGANLGPWNVEDARLELRSDGLHVDGVPLVFFHFQGLKELRPRLYDTNLDDYGARLTCELERHVYRPYLDALSRMQVNMGSSSSMFRRVQGLRGPRIEWRRPAVLVNKWVTAFRARVAGSIIHT